MEVYGSSGVSGPDWISNLVFKPIRFPLAAVEGTMLTAGRAAIEYLYIIEVVSGVLTENEDTVNTDASS